MTETSDSLKIEYDAFEVTGCWVNIGPAGAAHREHSHPNNFLGGVYYARVSPGGDTITFSDPRLQATRHRPGSRFPAFAAARGRGLKTPSPRRGRVRRGLGEV